VIRAQLDQIGSQPTAIGPADIQALLLIAEAKSGFPEVWIRPNFVDMLKRAPQTAVQVMGVDSPGHQSDSQAVKATPIVISAGREKWLGQEFELPRFGGFGQGLKPLTGYRRIRLER